jgi:diguanylate cyclase (GGDEF)-like protein
MRRVLPAVLVVWLALVFGSLGWNARSVLEHREMVATQTARSFFQEVVATRAWNAGHGGVYAPVTAATQPNPWLEDPRRDIVVDEELTLTMINPAYMTRQISELTNLERGVQFHITSLDPLRPGNAPTELEAASLRSFEQGVREVAIFGEGDDETFFYMAPLVMDLSCMKCHHGQGQEEGDIRGGISVRLPTSPPASLWPLIVGHLCIGLLGAVVTLTLGSYLNGAYATIERQAILDPLTGVYNRRFFADRLQQEFARHRREDFEREHARSLSLVMIDVDHFKRFNDSHGHLAGDECLRALCGAIQDSLERPGDFVARYGGEEFVLLLPDTPLAGAAHIAERIRALVESLDIQHTTHSQPSKITVSAGVATTSSYEPGSHERLIRRADNAMYLAKQRGKNRVELTPDETSEHDERQS